MNSSSNASPSPLDAARHSSDETEAPAGLVYIFLDVDGVLNSLRTCVAFGGYKTEHLDPTAIKLVDHLCRAFTKAGLAPKVVISSTWRMKYPDPQWWAVLFAHHGCDVTFVGITPDIHDIEPNRRGREILAWMTANAPGAAYVCLDDDSDFLPDQPLALTSHIWGLGLDEIDHAYHLVTGDRLFMSTLRTDTKWKALRAVARERSEHLSPPSSEDASPGRNQKGLLNDQ